MEQGVEKDDSWFSRLAKAVSSAMALVLSERIKDVKRQRHLVSSTLVEDKLFASYTENSSSLETNSESRPTPQLFPILDLQIADWKNRFTSMHGVIDIYGSTPNFDQLISIDTKADAADMDPWYDELPMDIINDATTAAEQHNSSILAVVEERCSTVQSPELTN